VYPAVDSASNVSATIILDVLPWEMAIALPAHSVGGGAGEGTGVAVGGMGVGVGVGDGAGVTVAVAVAVGVGADTRAPVLPEAQTARTDSEATMTIANLMVTVSA
jgi:hypothetical protein